MEKTLMNMGIILVVEDDESVSSLFQQVIVGAGHIPIVVPSCEDAMNAAIRYGQEVIIDAAIVDVGLPDTDGIRCAEMLLGMIPDLKILLTSGDSTIKTNYPLLEKPFQVQKLLEAIEKLFSS